jgi:hypothetical protein
MVKIADIRDRQSFRIWLEETKQPREVCVALAARAALRVLPISWERGLKTGRYSPLLPLRAVLVASVAGLAPPSAIDRPGAR